MIFGLLFFIQWIFIKLEYIEGKKWRRVEDLNLWWLVTTNGFQPFTIDLSDNSPRKMILYLIVCWRRGWDLNPRDSSAPPRRFRVARLRPLGHPSVEYKKTACLDRYKNGGEVGI